MKKILIQSNLKSGGIEKFLMNLMKDIKQSECELHFVVPYAQNCIEFYEPLVKKWGAIVHKHGGEEEAIAYKKKAILKKRILFFKLLKTGKFDTCYINVGGTGAVHLIETYMAIVCKVPNIIVHSHTSQITNAKEENNSKMKKNAHKVLRWLWPIKGVNYLACSELAAEWLFPNICKKGNYEVIPCGVEANNFKFNELIRHQMRKKYGLNQELTILNVGRLSKPKNHFFLIKIFNELVKIRPDSRLILVGEGELEEEIKLFVKELGLQSKVIITGAVTEVYSYYSMADVFLFPSLYEGFGIVLLEAQANGIPILASDCIPEQVKVTDAIRFTSLQEDEKEWAKKVIEIAGLERNKNAENLIINSDFNLPKVNKKMRNLLKLDEEI